MDNPEINLPENADKLLFAEDIVSYVMTHLYFDYYEGTRATPYREFIFNAFNDAVRSSIDVIGHRLLFVNHFLFDSVERMSEPDGNVYQEIIADLAAALEMEGFEPKRFILYSTNVSIIGAIMRKNGFDGAADIAISAIYEFIKDIDMLGTGWNTLNVLCSTISTMRQDVYDVLTPQSLSPETYGIYSDSEEEDSQMSSSDERDSAEHSENEVGPPREENGIQVNMADDLGVNINPCSINVGSHCVPLRKELLQPNPTGEVVLKGETESTKNEMPLTYSINDLFQIKNDEFENHLISPSTTEENSFQTVDSVQEERTSTLAIGAKSEPEKYLTNTKDFKLEADYATSQKSLQLNENTSQIPTSRECKNCSDDKDIIANQQGNSE